MRKGALPRICHMTAFRRQLLAPGELSLIKPAASRVLPLGLGGQLLPGPGRVGFCVAIGDLHDGMIVYATNRTMLAIGLSPTGSELELPPIREIAKIDRMIGRAEHQRSGFEHVRQRARIVPWIGCDFCYGDVASSLDEVTKLLVGDWC